jgi:hypothetical protein
MRNTYKILVGKPVGKIPVEKPSCRWDDSIRIDLREIGWEGLDWMHPARDTDQCRALVNTVMNILVPYKAENFFNS